MKSMFSSHQLREMFFLWLDDIPAALPFSVLQPALARMDDAVMPADLCRRHQLPEGCSVGDAARSVIWLLGPDGEEYRLDGVINFADEGESSEWWRNNQHDPRRVVVETAEGGRHSMRIAPIRPSVAS
jgi:hypothetical protein